MQITVQYFTTDLKPADQWARDSTEPVKVTDWKGIRMEHQTPAQAIVTAVDAISSHLDLHSELAGALVFGKRSGNHI